MSDLSYDYSSRSGVRPISWDEFHGLVKALAVAVAPWRPEMVLPVLRGGAYPGALLAHILQVEVYPCLLYTSPSPRDRTRSRMPSSA